MDIQDVLSKFRRGILTIAGDHYYTESGEFFDRPSDKKYIQFKQDIEELKLPEEVEFINDRIKYQKEILYYFIKSSWKRVNDEVKEGTTSKGVSTPDGIPKDQLIKNLQRELPEPVRKEICGRIPRDVLREIELRYASELKKPESTIGGSIRKRNSSSTRRRPSRKSSATKPRRRPRRRTSRK